jgi:hypothetical protein
MSDGDESFAETPLSDIGAHSDPSETWDPIGGAGRSIPSVVPSRPKMFCRTVEASKFDAGAAGGLLTLSLNCGISMIMPSASRSFLYLAQASNDP